MIWDPDCQGPCECPGEEVAAQPADVPIPETAEGREAEVRNRHYMGCADCRRYVETGDPACRPTPLET